MIHRSLLLLLLTLLLSCTGAKQTHTATAANTVPDLDPSGIPASSVLLLSMQSPQPLSALLGFTWTGDGLSEDSLGALNKELGDYLVQELGVDPLSVHSAAAFLAKTDKEDPVGAFIVRTVAGVPNKSPVFQHQGTNVYELPDKVLAAVQEGTLIIGDEDGVRLVLDVLAGDTPQIAAGQALWDMVQTAKDSYLTVAADISSIPELPPLVASYGVSAGMLSWTSEGVRMEAHGDPEGLKSLSELIRTSVDAMVAYADVAKRTAKMSGNVPEAAGAIYGAYHLRYYAKNIRPKLEGKTLSVDVAIPSNGAYVPVMAVGILAAVAVPAFMKYIKKSKASEARQFLRKIADAALVYHADTKTLPASVALTPAQPCCNGEEKCPPNPAQWQHPTWQALNFAMLDPHYYTYEFTSTDHGFVARAVGDLDCDGDFSFFTISGEVINGELVTGDIAAANELE